MDSLIFCLRRVFGFQEIFAGSPHKSTHLRLSFSRSAKERCMKKMALNGSFRTVSANFIYNLSKIYAADFTQFEPITV